MAWDYLLPIFALVPIAFGAWHGWAYGATTALRHLIAHLLALLAAMRFWQPVTTVLDESLQFDPRLIAVVAFFCVYLVTFTVAGFAAGLRTPVYRSVQPNPVDQLLGVIAGAFTGSIVGGLIALLATLVAPRDAPLNETLLVARAWPGQVFRTFETQIARIPAGSPDSALMPHAEFDEERADPDASPDESGMVTMIVIPKIVWK